jgi:hypothetical protein
MPTFGHGSTAACARDCAVALDIEAVRRSSAARRDVLIDIGARRQCRDGDEAAAPRATRSRRRRRASRGGAQHDRVTTSRARRTSRRKARRRPASPRRSTTAKPTRTRDSPRGVDAANTIPSSSSCIARAEVASGLDPRTCAMTRRSSTCRVFSVERGSCGADCELTRCVIGALPARRRRTGEGRSRRRSTRRRR